MKNESAPLQFEFYLFRHALLLSKHAGLLGDGCTRTQATESTVRQK
jgi:hypothetical protein